MFIKKYIIIGLFLFTSAYVGILSPFNRYSKNNTIPDICSATENERFGSQIPETINIGLLVPEPGSVNVQALAAIHGAELAVKQANLNSIERNHISCKLIVRSCEGPWGMGSKAAVNLVFEDQVCALMTSLDGRNAHLAEQVIAKTKVAMLSVFETDPTLSQAFVPWFFRCVPNDNQQAEAISGEIVKKNIRKIIVISDDSYDGKLSSGQFVKKIKTTTHIEVIQFFYNFLKPDFNTVVFKIKSTGIKDVALFGHSETSLQLMKLFKLMLPEATVYGSLSVLGEHDIQSLSLKYFENAILISPGYLFTTSGLKFRGEYKNTYGIEPGISAAYAYDGMAIILETIKRVGTNRERIIEEMKNTNFEGVTGLIRFDEKGNRIGIPELMKIKNGKPSEINSIKP